MRFLALFFALQVLVFNTAPALSLLPELACCEAEGKEIMDFSGCAEEDSSEATATDSCNPFCCTACCFLQLPTTVDLALLYETKTPAPLAYFPDSLKLKAVLGIWHPPRQA